MVLILRRLNGSVIASVAKQSIVPQKDGLLRRFAPRNDNAALEIRKF
jgi:hypothetical protein